MDVKAKDLKSMCAYFIKRGVRSPAIGNFTAVTLPLICVSSLRNACDAGNEGDMDVF